MSRMLSDGIDILQLHWQDYDDLGYMDVIQHLLDIKRDGKLRVDELGLVNFDSRRVDEICETFGPRALVTNQVQVCKHRWIEPTHDVPIFRMLRPNLLYYFKVLAD